MQCEVTPLVGTCMWLAQFQAQIRMCSPTITNKCHTSCGWQKDHDMNYEVGVMDGAYEGRFHVLVPFICGTTLTTN